MHPQFIKEFINVIYRSYDDNVIIIRKKRRVKKSFEIFIKHTFVLFLIVILKILISSRVIRKIFQIIVVVIIHFYNMHSSNFLIRLKTITFDVFNLIAIIIYKLLNIDFDFNFDK